MPTPRLNIGFSEGPPILQASHGQFGILQPQVTLVDPSSAGATPAFPRLGTYAIGGQAGSAYSSAWANFLACHHVNIIGGYVGVFSESPASPYGTRQSFVASVKSLSTIGTKVGQYYMTDYGNQNNNTFDGNQAGQFSLCVATPIWWGWTDALTQTSHVINTEGGGNYWQTNQTLAGGKNGAGLYMEAAMAQNQYEFYWSSTGGTDEASNMDFLYHDNFIPVPAANIDYNASGSVTDGTTAGSTGWNVPYVNSFQQGLATGSAWIAANTSIMFIGNIAEWGGTNNPPLTYLSGILQGGVYESAFGQTYSTITFAGYSGFQNQYSAIMAAVASPALVILGHDNLTSTGTDPYQSSAYAAFRFGYTATLVNGNGYYFGNTNYNVGTILWFDEYAANTSGVCPTFSGLATSVQAGEGYLGQPTSTWGGISGPGPAVNYSGLWVRLFYNSTTGLTWAVINSPPGSGSLSINATTLHSGSAGFKMLTGTQAPSINNGTTVSGITIPAGYDGRIAQLL